MSDLSLFPAAFSMLETGVAVVRSGKIIYMNPAAILLAGSDMTGRAQDLLLPSHVANNQSASFITTAFVGTKSCTVRVTTVEDMRIHVFVCEPVHVDVTGTVLETLRSCMSNIKFSVACISGIAEELDNARLHDYISTLNRNYYRIKRTIDNLSTLSGIASKALPFHPELLDMTALCRDLADTVDILTRKQDVRIVFHAEEHLRLVADRALMQQLVLNLLANSILSCPRGGRVSLSLLKTGSSFVICVDDDGCGIAPEELASVFAKYKQPEALAHSGGSGIGLAVAKSIAELHNGAIIIESRGEGQGTSVRVMLGYDVKADSSLAVSPTEYGSEDMQRILTELSGCLTCDCYTQSLQD